MFPFGWLISYRALKTLRVTYAAGTTPANTVLVAGVSGAIIVVTHMLVTVSKAATASKVAFRAGFGPTTPTGEGVVASHAGIAPGGGFDSGYGLLGVSAEGDDLRYTADDPLVGDVDVNVSYVLMRP